MLLFWRYLLGKYLKVLLLGVFAIIGVLLVSRLEEIAQFATLGASPKVIFLFAMAQIPYILPIAVPIASLIAAMVLAMHLSESHELTSLRASALSLQKILTPLLLFSLFMACLNFYIVSEVATRSHLASRKMFFELTSINPLVLIQKAKIAQLDEAVVQIDPIKSAESAKNAILVIPHRANKRLNILLVKQLSMQGKTLLSKNTTLISSAESASFDHLMIENQELSTTSAPKFAYLLRKKGWKIANDHLSLPLLRARSKLLKQRMATSSLSEQSSLQHRVRKCQTELSRRLCLALAALTFPLLGIAFGIEIGRGRSKLKVVTVALLAAFALAAFFVAKEFDHRLFLASTLFLLPHGLIAWAAIFKLSRVQRGIE